jgi:3-methyladenine DNA glycosylase AlkC
MSNTSLKNFYNQAVVQDIATRIAPNYKPFKRDDFVAEIMRELPSLELKARALCIASALRQYLPQDYPEAVRILVDSMGNDDGSGGIEGMGGFRHLPFLNFVEKYGLDNPELSLRTLQQMTKYFSGEFAIRPYLILHPDLAFTAAHAWSKDTDWRVRRLASEGMRPRLPWGSRLKKLVIDPAPVLPILDRLFNDPHHAVRRSVANSLNDISKDHPALAVQIAARWLKENDTEEVRKTVHHALRTLRKKGDKATCDLLSIAHDAQVKLTAFSLEKDSVMIGETIGFNVTLVSEEKKSIRLVVHYAVHHQRKNGTTAPKIFKLAQVHLKSGEKIILLGKHSFKKITTRRYYPGEHKIEIIAAGVSYGEKGFVLRAEESISAAC